MKQAARNAAFANDLRSIAAHLPGADSVAGFLILSTKVTPVRGF